jgi:hypothetical protein
MTAPSPAPAAPSPESLESLVLPWPDEGRSWDGQPMARIGLRMEFFFGGREAAVRRALLQIVEQYAAAAGGAIRRYFIDGDRQHRLLAPGQPLDLERLRQRVDQPGADWSINLSAEPDVRHPSPWSLATLASDRGTLVMYFPLGAFANAAPGAFRALFARWCSALHARHAYAGFGFVLPVEVGNQDSALRRIGPWAQRFVGLDTDLPVTTALWCREGIRCVNWLTAINAKWLERVGGADAVLQRADDAAVSALPYAEGSIFAAGPAPQIADAEAGLFPADFQALGRVLAPLRSPYPGTIFDAPPGYEAPHGFTGKLGWRDARADELADLHYGQRWLARFDG